MYAVLDPEEQERRIDIYAAIMVGIGAISGTAMFFLNYMFGYSGEKLTERLRQMSFKSLLRQVSVCEREMVCVCAWERERVCETERVF